MPESQAHQLFLEEIGRLLEMAQEWIALFPQAAAQGQHWQRVLAQVQAHVSEDTCRLAMVGAVKSGKSTMINALVGQDLLRRGAGILTAMITRVQPGPEPRAVLQFKDWDEINGEIRRALGLLPNPRLVDRAEPLDLKEAQDRELLAQVLAEARESELWTEGSLDQNYLLLKSYLEGYDLLKDLMPASGVLSLAGADLARHRELVTREATAVYLKDVLLTIPFPWPAAGIELGDCQGSDSPFPQHLAQVLAYLVKSDLALYVISSRVGLRQADFQFLGELKRMGLMPHILALLNLDLGEHASYEDVVKIRDRVAQELVSWQPDPRVYAFSALKLLLDRREIRGEDLDPREAAVLKVWALDPESAAFSESEAARFEADL
ncbi:MAG: dynamin family protein, partial [Desulfobaccales bacterium]